MYLFVLSVLYTLLASTLALPSSNKVVHEKRDRIPQAWAKRSKVDGLEMLPVRIGLVQSNLDKGHDMLMEVSRHDSPRYGQHYTASEINDIFAPKESTVKIVTEWLASAGIDPDRISQSVNKQWLQFESTVMELEELLDTEYHVYLHEPTGKHNVACDKYHLPKHVQSHVDYITPGIKLFATGGKDGKTIEKRTFGVTSGKGNSGLLPPPLKSLGMTLEALLAIPELQVCSVAITPPCIKALYNITVPKYTTGFAGNELGIFEDLNDMYSQTDLNEFWVTFAQNIPFGTGPTLKAVDGATAPVSNIMNAGPESDLDFQISYPIIYPQKEILFQTDDDYYEANYIYEGFLNNFLDAIDGSYCTYSAFGETGNSPLDPPYPDPNTGGYKGALQCGVYKPTNVISISYGGQEFDLPASYQKRQCNEFMKLGMQGVSIVVASGDSGVAGPAGDDNTNGCLNSTGTGTAAPGTVFSPDFPATCPYLTVLGATYLPIGANVKTDSEVAVTRFPSGGGFSNIYPIPSYQASAVNTYLTQHKPPYASYQTSDLANIGANGGIYNSAGRGYPDFSAVGDNVVIFNAGAPTLIGGTSAAAPVFAAILTRINEERLSAGKSRIGFVNPTLYAHPEVFHDITQGSNPGCGTNGFAVSSGWDPVTGLGTPNYPAMLKLFMGL